MADIDVACKDSIDVACKLGALVLVDGVGNVGGAALDLDLSSASQAAARDMAWFGSDGGLGAAGMHALLGRGGIADAGDELDAMSMGFLCANGSKTHIDIVFQFDSAGTVEFDLFECLTHHVIRLSFRSLDVFDGGVLVYIALVFDI